MSIPYIMSSNLQTLFNNRSLPDIQRYQSAIHNIRRGAKTKKQKIKAIRKQVNYMNTMYNTGAELGGNEGFEKSHFIDNNDTLDFFKKMDIDYMFNAIAIPRSKGKHSILGNVQDAYRIIRYLDFTAPQDGPPNRPAIDPHNPPPAGPMMNEIPPPGAAAAAFYGLAGGSSGGPPPPPPPPPGGSGGFGSGPGPSGSGGPPRPPRPPGGSGGRPPRPHGNGSGDTFDNLLHTHKRRQGNTRGTALPHRGRYSSQNQSGGRAGGNIGPSSNAPSGHGPRGEPLRSRNRRKSRKQSNNNNSNSSFASEYSNFTPGRKQSNNNNNSNKNKSNDNPHLNLPSLSDNDDDIVDDSLDKTRRSSAKQKANNTQPWRNRKKTPTGIYIGSKKNGYFIPSDLRADDVEGYLTIKLDPKSRNLNTETKVKQAQKNYLKRMRNLYETHGRIKGDYTDLRG